MWVRIYLTCWTFPILQTNSFSHQIQVINLRMRVARHLSHTLLLHSPCRLPARRAFRKTSSNSWWMGSKSAWYDDTKAFSCFFSKEVTAVFVIVMMCCDLTGQHGSRRSTSSAVAKDPVVVSGHFSGANWPTPCAHTQPCAPPDWQEGGAGVCVWSQTFRYPKGEPQPGSRGGCDEITLLTSICYFTHQPVFCYICYIYISTQCRNCFFFRVSVCSIQSFCHFHSYRQDFQQLSGSSSAPSYCLGLSLCVLLSGFT